MSSDSTTEVQIPVRLLAAIAFIVAFVILAILGLNYYDKHKARTQFRNMHTKALSYVNRFHVLDQDIFAQEKRDSVKAPVDHKINNLLSTMKDSLLGSGIYISLYIKAADTGYYCFGDIEGTGFSHDFPQVPLATLTDILNHHYDAGSIFDLLWEQGALRDVIRVKSKKYTAFLYLYTSRD